MTENSNIDDIKHIRLTPFHVINPDLWFLQAESQFMINKITSDKNKFHLVLSNLPMEIFSNVTDIASDPPKANMYETLKKTIIQRLSLSNEKRLEKLISNSEIADGKPSFFYRELERLAGDNQIINQDLLLRLWKRRLPKHIIIAITASGKVDKTELLDLADNIWENSQSSCNNIYSMGNASAGNLSSSAIDKSIANLTETFQKMFSKVFEKQNLLEAELNSIKNDNWHKRRDDNQCSSCRARSSSRNRFNDRKSNKPLCNYHYRFGEKAKKCAGSSCLMFKYFNSHQDSKNE